MHIAKIQKSVSGLPEKDRADLAAWLLDSLPPADDEDSGGDSIAEALRRRDELDAGNVKPVPERDFWKEIERERKQWR